MRYITAARILKALCEARDTCNADEISGLDRALQIAVDTIATRKVAVRISIPATDVYSGSVRGFHELTAKEIR